MGLEVLYLLIPASIVLALLALTLFLWAIRSGQFDDLETPAIRILFDDGGEPAAGDAAEPAGLSGSAGQKVPDVPDLHGEPTAADGAAPAALRHSKQKDD